MRIAGVDDDLRRAIKYIYRRAKNPDTQAKLLEDVKTLDNK